MKTLVLLSALFLLAFQVQADPIQKTDEKTITEVQPGEEDQAVSVSFGNPEDVKSDLICDCRLTDCCFGQRLSGASTYQGHTFQLCCHLALGT
uniref:Alpha-defensin N-terminal domain-containing protein n=1 Tax=Mus spicilegus TaxID=10103 RepID=A0A8C6GN82_MUSSI